MPPRHQNCDTLESREPSNRALPEALLYHGFDMPEGNLVVDALDCVALPSSTKSSTRNAESRSAQTPPQC